MEVLVWRNKGVQVPITRRWSLLNLIFLLGTLGLALVLVPMVFAHSLEHWGAWVVFLVMVATIGMSVTCGYHRLFSHRAYQARWPVRLFLLCFGAASFENSALQWASDHRIHHRLVDQNDDPYNSRKGFWYAHWIWVMEERTLPISGVGDLEKDPLVRWQHRHHFLIGAVAASLLPLLVGIWTHDLLGCLIIGVLLRIVVTHHTTFFINSAAHFYGTQPYSDANSARDNAFLAPLTYGEGYHNYHHMWQWDYRNGVKWYQWDPAKWAIKSMAWAGLASGLRAVPDPMIRRARIKMEEKALLARLAQAPPLAAEKLLTRVQCARQRLDQALLALQEHREAWDRRKAERKALRQEAWARGKAEWKEATDQRKREFKLAWGEWKAARLEVRRVAFAS
jgi:stearoyl-CoA desaturase (delta-9 desaturase)